MARNKGFEIDVDLAGIKALRQQVSRGQKRRVTQVILNRLNNAWASGAEHFIRQAIRRVLVDTGMSSATFFPLSRAIAEINGKAGGRAEGAIEQHIVANQKALTRKGIPSFPRGDRRPGFTSVKEGERVGKTGYTFSVPSSIEGNIVYRFSFQTTAFQHAIHESQGLMRQSLEAGIQAFEDTIRVRFEQDARFVLSEYFKNRPVTFFTRDD